MGNAISSVGSGTATRFLAPAVIAVPDGATITADANLGNVFTVTIAGNRTLANPLNPHSGQVIRYHVTQGAGGSHTLSYDTQFDFGAAGAPTLSVTAALMDVLGFEYDAALVKWCYIGSALGN